METQDYLNHQKNSPIVQIADLKVQPYNLITLQPYNLTTLQEEIIAFCAEWHTITEIAEHVHRSKQYLRGEVLPILKDQLEMSHPQNINHPKQQYRKRQQ